jgi:hypothetical protein
MRLLYLLCFISLLHLSARTQTINVSGQCMTGIITLDPILESVNGKIAYQGTGTVDGNAGVTISVYWLGAPDNVWVLDYDGQPYFQNSCNTVQPLSSPNIDCPWTPVDGTTCTGSTQLTITGSGVLAVRLLGFTATNSGGQVLLNWKTVAETNNKEFEIHRSMDGTSWQTIGTVPGNTNSITEIKYSYTDKTPSTGKNYYRLLQKDLNGHSWYSGILTVDIFNNRLFRLLNEPAPGKYQLEVQSNQAAEISVLDISGKKLWSLKAAKGMHQIDLSAYPAGMYLLRIKMNDEYFTQKLINP